MPTANLALEGNHNIKNAMAASTIANLLGIRKSTIRECLENFQGVEHRLENVLKINKVQYINDSKATNVNATYYALESMEAPTVWIVGGEDKGNDYTELFPFVNEKVKAIICLGVDNHKLMDTFGNMVDVIIETQFMSEAIKIAYKVGLLSTVKILVNDKEYDATHTTPDSLTINRYLSDMNDEGVEYCFMEVSSHGIHQKRTEGLNFAGGIFTNLSHDHLDYHDTFAEYRNVKKLFFDQLSPSAFALTNSDDKNGDFMLQNTKAKKYGYALKTYADYKAQILENQFSGLLLKINDSEVWTRLIGNFNAYNILAIYGTAELLGLDKVEILRIISE